MCKLQVVLYVGMATKAFAQSSSFTGSIVMVNAAPHASQLGTVNGIGQTMAALVRGVYVYVCVFVLCVYMCVWCV
jgi:hypothetical protein